MEAKTEIQTYLEQGQTSLAQGHAREAAIAYAHSAQIEPDNPAVHLGLAEANLALGNYGVVQMACRKVFELQPEQGVESQIAQALLDLLDRRYERALQTVDAIIRDNPGTAYVHALRSYLLRATGQDYDANLARARATRLSYGGRFENSFPALEPSQTEKKTTATSVPTPVNTESTKRQPERETVPTWSRPGPMQRRLIRTRFALSQRPGLITNILIGVYLVMFLLTLLRPSIAALLSQNVPAILSGQVWRLITGTFVLSNNPLSLLLSLLFLFFIGRAVEIFYGPIRYLAIFLLSGVCSTFILLLLFQVPLGMGANGALSGLFGALGAFYVVNRRSLGIYGSNAIFTWGFWLVLWLVIDLTMSVQMLIADLALLLLTMIISFLLLPRSGNRRSLF